MLLRIAYIVSLTATLLLADTNAAAVYGARYVPAAESLHINAAMGKSRSD